MKDEKCRKIFWTRNVIPIIVYSLDGANSYCYQCLETTDQENKAIYYLTVTVENRFLAFWGVIVKFNIKRIGAESWAKIKKDCVGSES